MPDVTTVACPQCAVKLKLKGDVAGKKVACPKCGTTFRLRSASTKSSDESPSKPTVPPRKPEAGRSAGSSRAKAGETLPKKRVSAAAAAQPAKKKKKRRPPAEEFDDFYDDFAPEEDDGAGDFYDDGYDDFGGGSGGAYDDPYSATPRRKKKKKKSGSKKKKADSGGLQAKLHAMGILGWVLAGSVAGLLGIALTTLGGVLDITLMISAMALVTGSLVGAAIRFVAMPTQGWAPGITSVVVALAAIMLGKIGAFYVWTGDLLGNSVDGPTLQQTIADATSDSALISEIADEVQTEWTESGKVTLEQIADWQDEQWEDYEEEDYEDYEVGEPYDYSQDYMPVIWDEATRRWNQFSDEEKGRRKEAAAEQVRDDFIGDDPEAREMTDEQVQQEVDKVVRSIKIIAATFAACVNIFFPLYSLFFFCGGVYGAFKLASNLGDDT